MATTPDTTETRRGAAPADEAYLKRVGERVRLARARRGMSRKSLSKASGVSERYLAELERGAGNASLLVLRQLAEALSIEAAALVSDAPERAIDLTLAIHQLERLSPADLGEARRLLAQRFGPADASAQGRIALVGLRGAGKTTLGKLAAEALGVPSSSSTARSSAPAAWSSPRSSPCTARPCSAASSGSAWRPSSRASSGW